VSRIAADGPERLSGGSAARLAPWLVVGAVLAVTIVALHAEGRRWWCECGHPWLWVSGVWTSHCSQHLADPYSLTHVSHGLIFFAALLLFRRRLGLGWRFCIALTIAAGWEVLENSSFIINRYREETMSLDYLGDSIGNSLGDIASCALGFVIARWLGLWWSLAIFVATEVALLFLIRDDLTLNVIMLIHPIPAIKAWQSMGH
jgi:hypothetical protein